MNYHTPKQKVSVTNNGLFRPQKQPISQHEDLRVIPQNSVKKLKSEQTAFNESNTYKSLQQDFGHFIKPISAQASAFDGQHYEEYEEQSEWKISSRPIERHNPINLPSFGQINTPNPFHPSGHVQSIQLQQDSTSNKNNAFAAYEFIENTHQVSEAPKHTASDTPKFANPNSISMYINKVWEGVPQMQSQRHFNNTPKYQAQNVQPCPPFDSTFKELEHPLFDVKNVDSGQVSEKLCRSLGMKSEKEAPPYLSKLIKVGIPNYCKSIEENKLIILDRDATFYGINTKVPKSFDKESWIEAGVKPNLIDGETRVDCFFLNINNLFRKSMLFMMTGVA